MYHQICCRFVINVIIKYTITKFMNGGNVMNNDKVVILYSGGTDSTLLVELARSLNKEIFCVLISYNQLHIKELEFAMTSQSECDPQHGKGKNTVTDCFPIF